MSATLGAGGVSARFVDLVQQHTQGNAFFIEEVVRALVEREDAYLEDGVWDCRAGADLAIPRTVYEAVGERLSRLSPQVQTLLSEASVLGETFGFDEVDAMSDRPEAEIDEGLTAAMPASVIRVGERDRYAFKHALTQRVLYRELTPHRRKRLHLAAGSAIEQQPERIREQRAAEMAWHFLEGGAHDRALRYALLAGERDEARFAHEEAARHYRSGLELARNSRDVAFEAMALEKLGRVLTNAGRYQEAWDLLETAVALYHEVDDPEGEVRVTVQLGAVHRATGTSDAWIARVQELLARLDTGQPPPGITELYVVLETLLYVTGGYREALNASEQAAQLAREAGDGVALSRAETGRGTELIMLGRLDDGLHVLESTIALPEAADDPFNLVRAFDNASHAYLLHGSPVRSREMAEQSMILAERIQSPWDTVMALSGLGASDRILGEWTSARAHLERGIDLIRTQDFSWWAIFLLLELGGLYVDSGEWERAARILDDALALAQRSQHLEGIRAAQRLLAELDVLEGRPALARSRLEPLLDRPGLEELQVTELLPTLATAYEASGEPERAEAVIQEGIRRATAANARLVLASALAVRGRLLAARGDVPVAECDLAQAAQLANAMPCPYLEARALFAWGIIGRDHGDLEGARTRLEPARLLFIRLGARPLLHKAEQILGTL